MFKGNPFAFRPDFKFKDHLRDESSYEDQPKKQILKRESASFEEVINNSILKMDDGNLPFSLLETVQFKPCSMVMYVLCRVGTT